MTSDRRKGSGSPKAFEEGGFKGLFYSKDLEERAHVHVRYGEGEAKFWLFPTVVLEKVEGKMKRSEIRRCLDLVRKNRGVILEKWHEHLAKKR